VIRAGMQMGPLNHNLTPIGGGARGRNPFDWMEYVRRSPQGSVLHFENTMRGNIPMNAMAVVLGLHVRCGIEKNIRRVKGERFTTVKQIEQMVKLSGGYGRKVATAEEARKTFKIGTWYNSVEETLQHLGMTPNREAGQRGFLTWDTDGTTSLSVAASDSHPMSYCLVRPTPAAKV
jgi:hypothetical protein